MNITPRATEVKAVVSLMESDEFDTAEQMAKALIKEVYAQFLERDWSVHVYRWPNGLTLLWGPFTSEKEGEKFAKSFGLGGDHRIYPMFSPSRQQRTDAAASKAKVALMCRCGHPEGLHQHNKAGGRCVARRCTCRKLTEGVTQDG